MERLLSDSSASLEQQLSCFTDHGEQQLITQNKVAQIESTPKINF